MVSGFYSGASDLTRTGDLLITSPRNIMKYLLFLGISRIIVQ